MSSPSLPADLVDRLRRVADVAAAAGEDRGRRQRAMRGSARLFYAARRAGWPATQLADALGVAPHVVRDRIQRLRRDHGEDLHPGVVDVPPPPVPPPVRPAPPAVALDEKPWLRAREVVELLDLYPLTLRNWRRAGLLPNTIRTDGGWYLYSREDLVRVLAVRVPYKGRGPTMPRPLRGCICSHLRIREIKRSSRCATRAARGRRSPSTSAWPSRPCAAATTPRGRPHGSQPRPGSGAARIRVQRRGAVPPIPVLDQITLALGAQLVVTIAPHAA